MRDYYAILAVPMNETLSGLRAAYGDFVRSMEAAGTSAHPSEVEQTWNAFSILLDSFRRQPYDNQMRRAIDQGVSAQKPESPAVEIPSILSDAKSVHPSYDAMWARLLRNFTNVGTPKSEHAENLNVQVRLAADQTVPETFDMGVPAFSLCPACRGRAFAWPFRCAHCDGLGRVEEVLPMRVAVPRRIPAEVQRSLDAFGITNFYMSIQFTR